jgi:hypothetical protein
LLTAEEGEFYNVPVPDDSTDLAQLKVQMRKTSITKKAPVITDKDLPHNMAKKDLIRASDFNFLMVLGKGILFVVVVVVVVAAMVPCNEMQSIFGQDLLGRSCSLSVKEPTNYMP